MIKYTVTLTTDERQYLEKLVSAGKAAARLLTHARVLLLADEGNQAPGRTNEQIVAALGVGERTGERIRQRFVTEGLEAALQQRPQPPRLDTVKIQGPIEELLIQVACSDPPPGRSRWTLPRLADQMVMLGCLASVSTDTGRQA